MEDIGLPPNSFFLLFLEKWRMSTLYVVLNLKQYICSMTGQKPVVSGTGVGQVKTFFFFPPLNLLSVYLGDKTHTHTHTQNSNKKTI